MTVWMLYWLNWIRFLWYWSWKKRNIPRSTTPIWIFIACWGIYLNTKNLVITININIHSNFNFSFFGRKFFWEFFFGRWWKVYAHFSWRKNLPSKIVLTFLKFQNILFAHSKLLMLFLFIYKTELTINDE